ncbi:hypothetical protein KI387_036213, partial [Taxus chinensis]
MAMDASEEGRSNGNNIVDYDESEEEEVEVNVEVELVCALEELRLCRKENQKLRCTVKDYEENISIFQERQSQREEEEANDLN